jgi:release factor glutamine methyltransferase
MQYFKRNNITYKFEIFPQVYPPSDDSFLMAENFRISEGQMVLDMGTGCGIQGIVASKEGGIVTACDISGNAVECARYNAHINGVNMKIFRSDLFQKVTGVYDVILFNPPYLTTDPAEPNDLLRRAWDGGRDGRKIIDRFLLDAPNFMAEKGRIFLVHSSINDLEKTITYLENRGFNVRIVAEKKLFFEKLYLLEIFR